MTDTKLLTPKQLADILQVSLRTVRRLHERRKIPQGIPVGASLRWREADVRRWIERGGK